jgi:hypothetical protein
MVFIDESELPGREARDVARLTAAAQHVDDLPARPARAPRPGTVQRPKLPVESTAAPSLGCLGSVVRLLLFAAVIWYGGRWLLSIPEVKRLADAWMAGSFSDDQVNAAINAVRTHILQLLGVSPRTP